METHVIFENEPAEIGPAKVFLTLSIEFAKETEAVFVLEGRSPSEFGGNTVFKYQATRQAMWDWFTDPVTTTVFGGLFATCMARKLKSIMGDAIEECFQKTSRKAIVNCLIAKSPQLKGQITRAAWDCGTSIVGGSDP